MQLNAHIEPILMYILYDLLDLGCYFSVSEVEDFEVELQHQ
jgi:hypothetical protein